MNVWVVECRVDDDNPVVYGPYTERQAERVAARLAQEIALSSDDRGGNHHPFSFLAAHAYPLSRYADEDWLTGEQRREIRREVRQANADQGGDQ